MSGNSKPGKGGQCFLWQLAAVMGVQLLARCGSSQQDTDKSPSTTPSDSLQSSAARLPDAPPLQSAPPKDVRGNFDQVFFLRPHDADDQKMLGFGTLTIGFNGAFYGKKRDYILAFTPGTNLQRLAFANISDSEEADLLRSGHAIKVPDHEPIYGLGKKAQCGDVRFWQFKRLKDGKTLIAPRCFFKSVESPPGPNLANWKSDFNKIMAAYNHPNLEIGLWKRSDSGELSFNYWNFSEPGLDLTDEAKCDVAITVHNEHGRIVYHIEVEKVGMDTEGQEKRDEDFNLVRKAVIKALYPNLNDQAVAYTISHLEESEDLIEDKKGWTLSQVGNFTAGFGFTKK